MTASVLFTDIVDSTAMRHRLGDEAANDVHRRHDAAIAAAIEIHGGRPIRSLGDGLMATFEAAADAVAAGVAAQQAVTALGPEIGEPIQIRVGLSVGDVTFEDGNCHGSAVDEASALCAAAHGGQVLAADLIRALARGRGGFTYENYGELELPGMPEPVPTCNVGWEPVRADSGSVPFPPALAPNTLVAYTGRPALRAWLDELWERAKHDGPQTALLSGEAGIGKTRTAYEIARTAADRSGAVVLFGRCDEELRVPYQPFVEALDWQTLHAPNLALGRMPGELRRLVAELGDRVHGLPAPVSSDARTEEHRLFEAVSSWVSSLAADAPLVLVVDDLHWATKPTLTMLMHAIRHAVDRADDVQLLVIGTYRDTDVDRSHPLSSIIGDLRRLPGVHRLQVEPLDQDEVVALVEATAGHSLDEETRHVADRTFAETEGNPFFVSEVVRHLIERGSIRFAEGRWLVPDPEAVDIPEGVRDVIGQRLSRLSDSANDLLRAAAVIGREFDIDAVGALCELEENAVLDALDEACRSRIVEELDADRFRFTHELVRASLSDELSASRRRRMHRQIADLLAARPSPDRTALAHHAVEAGPRDGSLALAIGYVLDAAEHSHTARANAEAEQLYRKAIELLDEDEAADGDHRRLLARCGIGEVLRDQSDPQFRDQLLAVAADALAASDGDLVARAALANSRGFTSIIGAGDDDRIGVLESALGLDDGATPATTAQLLVHLAAELCFVPGSESRRRELAGAATALLEQIEDPKVRAHVRSLAVNARTSTATWLSMHTETGIAVADADRSGDPSMRAMCRVQHSWALQSIGDLNGAFDAASEGLEIAVGHTSPTIELTARIAHAPHLMHGGDLDGAQVAADACLGLGLELGEPDTESWWAGVVAGITRMRTASYGDPAVAGALADRYPDTAVWRAVHVSALAMQGQLEELARVMDRHRLFDLAALPRDLFWPTTLNCLASAAIALGDLELCDRLEDELLPIEDGYIHYHVGLNAPTLSVLADLSAARGDTDLAVERARRAVERFDDGSIPYALVTRVNLAGHLADRGTDQDRREAAGIVATTMPRLAEIGMDGWITVARGIEARASA